MSWTCPDCARTEQLDDLARRRQGAGMSALDELLPVYEFSERHRLAIGAPAA